jgi:xanthine/uracil permease
MLAINLATLVFNFVKTILEETFVYCWIAKLFPPIVMFTIVQTDMASFFPFFLYSLGNGWFRFGHWLK